MINFFKLVLTCFLFLPLVCKGDVSDFSYGPVFKDHGQNILIQDVLSSPKNQHFKVAFDVSKQSDNDGPNRSFNTVARFINMHVRAGVPIENIELALVVHGKATYDVLSETAHKKTLNVSNTNIELMNLLLDNSVKIYVCGQSALHLGLKETELFEGVQMSLSAMTAHALLQQNGYTLNPF